MRQNKKSGSKLLRMQTTVCIILIAVMLAVSFTGLYKVEVETPDTLVDALDQIVGLLNDPAIADGEEITLEIPESISVDLFLFIRFGSRIGEIVNIYNGMMQLSKYQNATSTNEYYQAYNDLRTIATDMKELVKSEEFVDAVALACAIVSGYSQSAFTGSMTVVAMVLTALLPICLLLCLAVALIVKIFVRKNTDKSYTAIIRCFKTASVFFVIVMALGLFDSNIRMSVGTLTGLCACAFGFVFSAVLSRRKSYTELGKKYLSAVQIVSGTKAVLFLGFFFCILRSGVVSDYSAIVAKNSIGYIRAQTYGEEFLEQYLFMLVAFIGLVALTCALSILPWTLFRMSGMLPKNKETAIFSTAASVFLVLVPVYVSLDDLRMSIDGGAKLLLLLAFILWTLMMACEIYLIVWRNKNVAELRESEKYAVLRGLENAETEWFDSPEEDGQSAEIEM